MTPQEKARHQAEVMLAYANGAEIEHAEQLETFYHAAQKAAFEQAAKKCLTVYFTKSTQYRKSAT